MESDRQRQKTGKGERDRENWRVTKADREGRETQRELESGKDREGREMQRELENDRDNGRQGRERDAETAGE